HVVEALLHLPQALGDVGELLDAARSALGRVADGLDAAIGHRGDLLEGLLAVLDEIAQDPQRQQSVVASLLLEDDLSEGDGGQVFARVVLDDADVLAGLDPAADLFERHVAALARIVELAISVSLDEPRHRGSRYHTPARGSTSPPGFDHLPSPRYGRASSASSQPPFRCAPGATGSRTSPVPRRSSRRPRGAAPDWWSSPRCSPGAVRGPTRQPMESLSPVRPLTRCRRWRGSWAFTSASDRCSSTGPTRSVRTTPRASSTPRAACAGSTGRSTSSTSTCPDRCR